MKTRKLLDGSIVPELDSVRILEIKTRCPEKWMLVDMETGEKYIGYSTSGSLDWKKVDSCQTLI